MAYVKGKDVAKYLRDRAKGLVKGKGRLLAFGLDVTGADDRPTIKAFYATVGDSGEASVQSQEEYL